MTKKSFSTSILHGKVRILSCSYTVRDHIYIYIYIFINKTFFPQEITLFIPSFIPNDTQITHSRMPTVPVLAAL